MLHHAESRQYDRREDSSHFTSAFQFIGQIPYEWGEKELTEYLAKSLHIHDPNEIQSQLRSVF